MFYIAPVEKNIFNRIHTWRIAGFLSGALILILGGCALFSSGQTGIAVSPENWKVHANEPLTTLADYYAKHNGTPRRSDLIACAAGGYQNMMTGATEPVSVYFYPKTSARDIRIFAAASIQTDTLNWA